MPTARLQSVTRWNGREGKPGPEHRPLDRRIALLWAVLFVLCVLFWIGVAVSVWWMVQQIGLA